MAGAKRSTTRRGLATSSHRGIAAVPVTQGLTTTTSPSGAALPASSTTTSRRRRSRLNGGPAQLGIDLARAQALSALVVNEKSTRRDYLGVLERFLEFLGQYYPDQIDNSVTEDAANWQCFKIKIPLTREQLMTYLGRISYKENGEMYSKSVPDKFRGAHKYIYEVRNVGKNISDR